MDANDPLDPSGSQAREEESSIDDLVAPYLDRLNAGEKLDPVQILAEHPQSGAEILKDLRTYLSLESGDPLEQPLGQPLGTLGDFTLRRQIGRGGMGVVYEAWEGSMDRRVALKVLPAGIAADTKAFTRFCQEAKLAGKLHHPNIVPVFGMGIKEDTPHYSMEFIEGETLAEIAAKLKDADPEVETAFGKKDSVIYFGKLAEAFADVADGLQHAHSHKIVHRDIKPSNLILDGEADRGGRANGRLRILDFGLARLEGQESLTMSGDLVGTPQYMSPEQARRKKVTVDYRTDIYSLGATLYEMLTLEPPFRGKDHQDTLSQIIERDPPRPSGINPRVPRDLETIVLKCLRKEPGDRYGTAEALGQDLRRFVRGEVIEARPQAGWERLTRRVRRQKVTIFFVILALLLLLASGLLLRQRWAESRKANEARVRAAVMDLEFGLGWYRPGEALVSMDLYPAELKRVEDALRDLDAASKAFPTLRELQYYSAKGLLLLRRHTEALNALDDVLKVDPSFAPASALRTFLLDGAVGPHEPGPGRGAPLAGGGWAALWSETYRASRDERWSDAAAAYGQLIDLESAGEFYLGSSIELRLARGLARLEEKNLLGAVEDFSWVEARWPGSIVPILLRGKAYCVAGRKDLAEEEFRRVLARPEPPEGFALTVTVFYLFLGKPQDALQWAERAPAGALRELSRASSLNDLNRWDESDEAASEAIRQDPRSVLVQTEAGQIFENHTEYVEARRCYARALELQPDCVPGLVGLGSVLMREGDFKESVEVCKKALTIDSSWSPTHIVLGRALAGLGAFQEAEASCNEAIRLDPKNALNHCHLGYVLSSQGKLEEALTQIEKALQLQPSNPHMQVDHGYVLFRRGRPAEALVAFARAIELLPKVPRGHEPLASIVRQLKNAAVVSRVMDRLAERIEEALSTEGEDPQLLRTLALARLHGVKARDPAGALALIQHLIEKGDRKDRYTQGLLGDILTQPEAQEAFLEQLGGLKPSPPSDSAGYTTVDALLGAKGLSCGEDDRLLVALRGVVSLGSSNLCAYVKARLLQCATDHTGAAREFGQLVRRDQSSSVCLVRFVESLRAAGDASKAERELRAALERGEPSGEEIWELWAAVSLADLRRAPADLLADLPHVARGDASPLLNPSGIGDDGYASDLRWLLERLQSGEAIRIRCGGPEYRDRQGNVWSGDGFCRSGTAETPYSGEITGTEDDALYRTGRRFPDDGTLSVYRLPLPRGRWRITLHFADVWFRVAGVRRFDVKIEGKEVLKDYAPPVKGSGMPDRQTFEAVVDDGTCDIEFLRRKEDPVIAAIEVEGMN